MTPNKRVVRRKPPQGLLDISQEEPIKQVVSLLFYEPEEQSKPKKVKRVTTEWKPEHDLSPEVLAAFKNRR